MKTLTKLALAVLLVSILSGCALFATSAVVGAFAWVEGELQREYQSPYAKAISSTEDVLKDLKIRILDKTDDGITCRIDAKQSDNTQVSVRVQNMAPKRVMIAIRVGRVGLWDRSVAETIHNYIKARL